MKYSIRKQTTYEFPLPPAGEEWHNPEGASAEEVGEGYRLLTEHERKLISDGKLKLGEISLFKPDGFYRDFSEDWDSSTGSLHYTYRVPDTTPITLSKLRYNEGKFYGLKNSWGSRLMMVLKREGEFVTSKNPCSEAGEGIGLMTFDGWAEWSTKQRDAEIKEFDSLLELVKWMEGK